MSTDLAPFGFHHVSCHRFIQFRCIGNLPFPAIDKPISDAFGQVASFHSLAMCCFLRRQEICGRIEQPRDIFLLAFLLFLFFLSAFFRSTLLILNNLRHFLGLFLRTSRTLRGAQLFRSLLLLLEISLDLSSPLFLGFFALFLLNLCPEVIGKQQNSVKDIPY